MRLRLRFLLWLVLMSLPIAAASLWTVRLIDTTLQERIEAALGDSLRLEAARLLESLTRYREHAETLADGMHVREFATAVQAARAGLDRYGDPVAMERSENTAVAGGFSLDLTEPPPRSPVIGGIDGFAPIDPTAARPLAELAERLLDKAARLRTEIVALRIVDSDGRPLGESDGYGWAPADPTLLDDVFERRDLRFGDAFADPASGEARLGIIAPILDHERIAVAALQLETRLGPIVDLVEKHEALGSTSEAHIAQPTQDGAAQFITLLRFDRDAAFTRIVPASADLPINRSLASPRTDVIRARDYRGADSILALRTLEPTGWGLVVKVDAAEALAPIRDVRDAALVVAAATIAALLAGWLFLLLPLGRRLQRTAAAAERIAEGRLDLPIEDDHADELGDVARSIDQLAADLDADRAKRSAVEARLRHQATHDELTGLANRKRARAVIEALADVPGQIASVVFLDLDRFKEVNDLHGHQAGDDVLRALARRLESAVGTDATLARWGGDEFLIILPDTGEAAAREVARRVKRAFDDPVATGAGEHRLGCSVGLASTGGGRSLTEVLADADALMYEEKSRQRAAGSVDAFAARAVESALEERRVELWLQPIIALPAPDAPRLVSAEALVRLRSRDGAVIAPDDFLAAVRKAPLGRALDRYVLARAIEALSRWRRAGLVDDVFRLSLNVTGASLREASFAIELSELLHRLAVPAANVVIEISEKTGDLDNTLLERLRQTGVGIALDDVGLHRNNLDRLVELAPDIAKLDRQWLDDPVVLPRLIDLCQQLGLQLVAEGVETAEQLTTLQALSVTRFQGFLFDRPRPAVQFIERWGRLDGATGTRSVSGEPSPDALAIVG